MKKYYRNKTARYLYGDSLANYSAGARVGTRGRVFNQRGDRAHGSDEGRKAVRRAVENPAGKQVIQRAKDEGVVNAFKAVRSKLDSSPRWL